MRMANEKEDPPRPPPEEASGPRPRQPRQAGTVLAAAGHHAARVVMQKEAEEAHPFYCTNPMCPRPDADLSKVEGELHHCPYCGFPLMVTNDPAQHGLRSVKAPIRLGAAGDPVTPPSPPAEAPVSAAVVPAAPSITTAAPATVPAPSAAVNFTAQLADGTTIRLECQPPGATTPAPLAQALIPPPEPTKPPSPAKSKKEKRESMTMMQYREDPTKWNVIIGLTLVTIAVVGFLAYAYVQRRDARSAAIDVSDAGVVISIPDASTH